MFKHMRLSADKAFLTLGLFFGLAFAFITPPFQAPDEYVHFFRAYSISEGQLMVAPGQTLPLAILEFSRNVSPDPLPGNDQNKQSKKALFDQFQQPFSDAVRAAVDMRGTAAYSPVAYLPQAAGILAGRLLRLPPILIFYLGRLVNLFIWLGLAFLALRVTPLYAWVLMALALLPMSLFQAASTSPDSLLNALSLLYIAGALRLAYNPGCKASFQQVVLLSLAFCLLSAIKPAYLLLAGLFLLVPAKFFASRLRWALAGAWLLSAGAAPIVLWQLLTKGGVNLTANSSPADQIRFLQAFPLDFLRIVWQSSAAQAAHQWELFVGVLGWLDTPLPGWVYIVALLLLIFAALSDHTPQVSLSLRAKICSFLIFIGTWFGIFILFFVTWTPAGAPQIEGVQGRYFIPVGALLFLPFYNQRLHPPRGWQLIICAGSAILLAAALRALLFRYYAI